MAKCKICNSKIKYNKYKIIKGEVYCPKCNPPTEKEKKSALKITFVKDAIEETIEKTEQNDTEVEVTLGELREEKKPKKRKKSKKE